MPSSSSPVVHQLSPNDEIVATDIDRSTGFLPIVKLELE